MSMTFVYRARTLSGERVDGTMRALNKTSALATLRERMLIPSRMEVAPSGIGALRSALRSKPRERLAFFRAYAALEQSGIDFSTALALLTQQARTPRFRETLKSIRSDVERGGEKLYVAMANRPDEFSDLEVAMVAAGEEAGNREEIFDRLATFLERDEKLRKRLQTALFYPCIVVTAAILIVVYLFAVVVPQFGNLFRQFGVEVPPLMNALLDLTATLTNPFVLIGGAALGMLTALNVGRLLLTPSGAFAFDRLRMRLPILGEAVRKTRIARIARVLATLLQSGVNQIRALDVTVPVCASPVYAHALERAREKIAAGLVASLHEALEETGVFEPLMLGFLLVGAQAGSVPTMLVKVAEYYEEDVESLLEVFPTVIQTIVTIALGAVVAAILYIVYVPLSSLASSIH